MGKGGGLKSRISSWGKTSLFSAIHSTFAAAMSSQELIVTFPHNIVPWD